MNGLINKKLLKKTKLKALFNIRTSKRIYARKCIKEISTEKYKK